MKLKELIFNVSWDEVREALFAQYGDAERSLDGYELVFGRLRVIEPEESKMVICMEKKHDRNCEYYDIYGISSGSDETWSLMTCPFNEWLGMTVNEPVLRSISVPKIVAHCLWEMTWIGFMSDQRQEFLDKLNLDDEVTEDVLLQDLSAGRIAEIDDDFFQIKTKPDESKGAEQDNNRGRGHR